MGVVGVVVSVGVRTNVAVTVAVGDGSTVAVGEGEGRFVGVFVGMGGDSVGWSVAVEVGGVATGCRPVVVLQPLSITANKRRL